MKTLALPSQTSRQPLADVVTATGGGSDVVGEMRARARAFAEPLLAGEATSSGENASTSAMITPRGFSGSACTEETYSSFLTLCKRPRRAAWTC